MDTTLMYISIPNHWRISLSVMAGMGLFFSIASFVLFRLVWVVIRSMLSLPIISRNIWTSYRQFSTFLGRTWLVGSSLGSRSVLSHFQTFLLLAVRRALFSGGLAALVDGPGRSDWSKSGRASSSASPPPSERGPTSSSLARSSSLLEAYRSPAGSQASSMSLSSPAPLMSDPEGRSSKALAIW